MRRSLYIQGFPARLDDVYQVGTADTNQASQLSITVQKKVGEDHEKATFF